MNDARVGVVVGQRYEILERIARGGMATVYRALDLRLDRRVALKVMHPHLAESPRFLSRFASEARSAARLSHPTIVGVADQGVDGDVVWLAMELLPGRTLREELARQGGGATPGLPSGTPAGTSPGMSPGTAPPRPPQ